jgi:hypothetical protein
MRLFGAESDSPTCQNAVNSAPFQLPVGVQELQFSVQLEGWFYFNCGHVDWKSKVR